MSTCSITCERYVIPRIWGCQNEVAVNEITETKMSSFWRNFNHWLHWKLSFWQLPVQPVTKISSKWRHFRFSVFDCYIEAKIIRYSHTRLERLGPFILYPVELFWGGVAHISVSKLNIIGSDNRLSPGRCQVIIRTNAGIFLTGPLGTNFS